MQPPPIDPSLSFLELYLPDEVQEADDAFFKTFEEDGRLAGIIGHASVAKLKAETSRLERNQATMFKNRTRTTPAPATFAKTENDWDEPISNDGGTLRKRFTPQTSKTVVSSNGKWELAYNARGELVGGREINP